MVFGGQAFLAAGCKLSPSQGLIDLLAIDLIDGRNLIMLIIIWVKISTAIFVPTKSQRKDDSITTLHTPHTLLYLTR